MMLRLGSGVLGALLLLLLLSSLASLTERLVAPRRVLRAVMDAIDPTHEGVIGRADLADVIRTSFGTPEDAELADILRELSIGESDGDVGNGHDDGTLDLNDLAALDARALRGSMASSKLARAWIALKRADVGTKRYPAPRRAAGANKEAKGQTAKGTC